MPSTNKTPLGFNQWVGTDTPKREDFNADNALSDKLIQENAAAAASAATAAGTSYDSTTVETALRGKAALSGAIFTGDVWAPMMVVNDLADNDYTFIRMYKSGSLQCEIFSTKNASLTIRIKKDGASYDYYLTPATFAPPSDGVVNLGSSSKRWNTGYFVTAPIVGSDERIKKDISSLKISLITKLLMSIPAVQYRLIDGDSGRLHYGFISQDVEKALTEAELSTMDFAGFIKSPVLDEDGSETGDYIYALRLEEFIPILWAHQQDIEKRLQAAGI